MMHLDPNPTLTCTINNQLKKQHPEILLNHGENQKYYQWILRLLKYHADTSPSEWKQPHCCQWLRRISVFMLSGKLKIGSISFMQLGHSVWWKCITSKSNGILWFSISLLFSRAFFHSCYYSQSILENGKISRAVFLAELCNGSPWYLSAKCQSP